MAKVETVERVKRRPGPPLPKRWQERYLELVRKHGNYYKPAHDLGISIRTAARERDRDPEFDAACLEAREIAADNLVDEMIRGAKDSGNPAGFIVQLKALRPAAYIEKHAITSLTLTANLNELPVENATLLLKQMLGATTPTTLKQLSAGDGP